MKKSRILFGIISAAAFALSVCKAYDMQYFNVNAASGLVIDYSDAEKNPYKQFYYSDEDEFFIDGITIYYNNEDVTSKAEFTFYTSPATTYDGKNQDYVVPFFVAYDNKSAEGALDVKIGLRGDANCDNKITLNDLVLVENEMLQNFCAGKSALTADDGFGIFLANADGLQKSEFKKPFGINDLNIADAFFINGCLNNRTIDMYESVLLKYAIKPERGEITVSSSGCKAGNIATVYVSQKSDNTLGAFEFSCKWSDPNLELVNVSSVDNNATVFSALTDDKLKIWGFGRYDALKDGDLIALQFKVPQNASINTDYDIYIHEINYFGSGIDISNDVLTSDGKIKVTSKSSDNVSVSAIEKVNMSNYTYGVKVWDSVVNHDTKSVNVPIMLLGGMQTKGLTMTVKCAAPLSIESLSNATSVTSSSDGIVGIYESEELLNVDFETLNVTIADNAKPGRYPINITIEDVDSNPVISVYNGSVIIREKSVICGDANEDGKLNIRDAAFIANYMSKGNGKNLSVYSDFNADGSVNIRDAAAISKSLVISSKK